MPVTPNQVLLFNGSINVSRPASGIAADLAGPTYTLITGQGKGVFFNNKLPVGALNSGDWYSDVISGAVLVSDGLNWYNVGTGAVAVIL